MVLFFGLVVSVALPSPEIFLPTPLTMSKIILLSDCIKVILFKLTELYV